MVLSYLSSPKLFNLCDHVSSRNPYRHIFIKFACVICGPFMPAIILANYIFYREQEYNLKRELQTYGNVEFDLYDDPDEEAQQQLMDEKSKEKENDSKKVSLFRKIQNYRYKAALNRKYYSYYRVIQASCESFIGKF